MWLFLQGLTKTKILKRMISTLSLTASKKDIYSDLEKGIEGGILMVIATASATGKQGVDCLIQAGIVDSLLKVIYLSIHGIETLQFLGFVSFVPG